MHHVPLIIRGKIYDAAEVEYGGRRGDTRFTTADVKQHLDELVLKTPASLSDLYDISFDEIAEFLHELGQRLDFGRNEHLQAAFALSLATSGLTEEILRRCYETVGSIFDRDVVRRMADLAIGIPYLEGWVEKPTDKGVRSFVRALGARAVHIVAGNVPNVSAVSIVRNIVTRSDMIIKTPSNDPLTAAAIARTMIEMAPDHPITKHLSVAYWKGGDDEVEETIYAPANIEKIVAWGGFASVSHIAKYIQPGIDLVTLDPKLSSSIVGKAAFASEAAMTEAAACLAHDIGVFNQEACLCARVVYIETGTDTAGLERANRFGKMVYAAIQALPRYVSAAQEKLDPHLKEELEGLRFTDLYRLVAGGGAEGGIIVSQIDEPVEFAPKLTNRVANLVPIDDLDVAIRATTSYTQTVGIYPSELADELRLPLALHGAQKIVSLGYASSAMMRALAGPQDGIEPLRRLCKWVVQDMSNPAERPLPK